MNKKFSLFLLFCVALIDFLGLGLVYPLFSYLLFDRDFHFLSSQSSDTERGFYLGVLLAIFSVGQFFSGPILGGFSDQIGRKKILVLSLAIGVVGYLLSVVGIIIQGIYTLLVSRLIIGIAAGNAGVVQAAISDLSSPENKTKHYAYYNTFIATGLAFGPFLGGVLSNPQVFHGYTLPFWLGALLSILNLLCIAWGFKETHVVRKLQKISFLSGVYEIKKAFQMKGIRVLMLTVLVFIFGWSFYFEFVSVYLIGEYHFDSTEIGYFYGYAGLWSAICSGLLIMPIIKRYSAKKILFYSLVLTGLFVFVFLMINHPIYIWFYLPPLLYFFSFVFPTSTTLVSDWAGDEMQGEVLGIFQSIQAVGWAAAPLFSGALLGIYYNMPILVGGGAVLLSALIYGMAYRKKLFN